jgi:hypothetical protein
MTHTLHRSGDLENLREDYVMLIMPARGINEDGAQEKMQQIWDILGEYEEDLVNFGNVTTGNRYTTDLSALKEVESRLVHAVFKDRDVLKRCLKEIKERDFGLSVVISGVYTDVEDLCGEIGLSPHTVEYSLGVHGNTDKLPHESVLEITTMCGHGMVSPTLVAHIIEKIRAQKLNYEDAAAQLAKGCSCGIFNPHRAKQALKKIMSNV